MTNKLIVFWFSICFGTAISAQPLDSLLARAIDQNLELKILEKEYLAALENVPQVSELPDPEVGLGAFPLPVETRLGAQLVRVSATQMFFWKGLREGRKDLEFAKAKALYERIEARALDLAFQIKEAYFQLYQLEQNQAILQRNLPILESLERLALTKVESGKTSAADVLRVQLKIEELKQELLIIEKAKTRPQATINQLLQRPFETNVFTRGSLSFATLAYDKQALTETIEKNHPLLRMFELQQNISRQAMALNDLNRKPTFGLGMDYIVVDPRNDAEPTNNGRDIIQLRATMKVPLYKKKYEAKEREEQIKIAAMEDQKTETLSRFMASIEKAFADYETAKLRMDLYDQQIEITKGAIQILESSYSTEGNQFDELLGLEKDLIDYDMKRLRAIVESHLAKSRIERYLVVGM